MQDVLQVALAPSVADSRSSAEVVQWVAWVVLDWVALSCIVHHLEAQEPSSSTLTMFMKQQQRSWIHEAARGRSVQNCNQGLRETCGNPALSYHTVAWWVKLFREGRDNRRSGWPHVVNHTLSSLLLCWMTVEGAALGLAAEEGICHNTVLHILPDILGCHKIAARWVSLQCPRCNHGNVMQLHRTGCTNIPGKVTPSLEGSLPQTKLGFAHTNRTWSGSQMHGSFLALIVQSAPQTEQREGDVPCGIWHWWSDTAPHPAQRPTVNSTYYCSFLRKHLPPALRRKRRYLLAPNAIILHDNARFHTSDAVTGLLRRWRWEIMEHPLYSPDESARLWSLRKIERTTAMDTLQHKRDDYSYCRAVSAGHQQKWTRWWCRTSSTNLVENCIHGGGQSCWRNVRVFASGIIVISEL
jgi:hypothetical protein